MEDGNGEDLGALPRGAATATKKRKGDGEKCVFHAPPAIQNDVLRVQCWGLLLLHNAFNMSLW
jgi:hypothetical protein